MLPSPQKVEKVTPTDDERLMARALAVITDFHYHGKPASDETYNVHSALKERLNNVRN